jgi:hypothetical protein
MKDETRDILFAIIDRDTEEYRLLDHDNNIVFRYTNGDVLCRTLENKIYWMVKLDRERFRFYIERYHEGRLTKKVILPTRTLLLWAVTDEAMYDSPFYYVPNYDNCLEKYLVYNKIPKTIIKKFVKPLKGRYKVFYNGNDIEKIEIYTTDMKVYREILSEIKSKEKQGS